MLKWCIIGCGDVVQRLVQDSLKIKNKSSVDCILTEDITSAKKFAKKYNIKKVLINSKKNVNKILNSEVNSIYIATPPDSHFYYIKIFSKKKINIVCEKPLIIKKSEFSKLKKLINKYKFNLYTCFYRRYLERFLYIKKILTQKTLGKILYFNIKYFHNEKNHPTASIIKRKPLPWRFVKKKSGGGNVFDMGVHSIDLIDFFLGEIKIVSSFKKNYKKLYDVEDTLVVNFELKNKILGQGSWCSVSNKNVDEFSIYGTKGSIYFSMNISETDVVKIFKNGKEFEKKIKMKQPLHKNMMHQFVNKLLKNNRQRKYEVMKSGLKTSNILDKIVNF